MDLILETLCKKERKGYVYLNNRMEENSLERISAILTTLETIRDRVD